MEGVGGRGQKEGECIQRKCLSSVIILEASSPDLLLLILHLSHPPAKGFSALMMMKKLVQYHMRMRMDA